jgi:hypothetical protein
VPRHNAARFEFTDNVTDKWYGLAEVNP